MKILLIGHTGYVGGVVLRKLSQTSYNIVCISRRTTDAIDYPDVRYIKGDVLIPETYLDELKNCDVVIYLPGIIREFPDKGITFDAVHFYGVKNLVDAAVQRGVKRFILMSANGVRENAPTEYLRTKFFAEEYLKKSNLEWTIFRPSVIFGYEKQGKMNFINVIRDLLKMPIFIPIIGDGKYRFQPVALDNLADAIVMSIDNSQSIGKTYLACGKDVYSYNEIVDIVLNATAKHRIKMHIPVGLMSFLAKIFEKYEWFPISREQIIMLLEENICPGGISIFDDFPIQPIGFIDEIKKNL